MFGSAMIVTKKDLNQWRNENMAVDFMTILSAACSQSDSVEEMDNFLNDTLSDVEPYSLTFGKGD